MSTPPGPPDRAAPMTAAPFVWREDGRPDWRSMWTSFCDLALHGGPPHRGAEQALRGPAIAGPDAASDPAMVSELRRGIWETTGLFSEPLSPGWIAITCESRAMAQWLGGAIAPENVEVRVDDDRVLLPAGPRFRLEDEVKSLVTVVAKTHHYGAMHGGLARARDEATSRQRFHCPACGLDVDVSRPGTSIDLDATCPVEGSSMARQRSPVPSAEPRGVGRRLLPGPLRVGVGGTGDARTALIAALRRRYGRRRAVVTSPAQAMAPSDHAVDLVLVEGGEDGEAPGFGADTVDATIGVLDASAAARALGRDDRGLDAWHLLVVTSRGLAKADLVRLEHDTSQRRGPRPVAFVDLATGAGIDVVAAWLERELMLPPWRERR